MTDQHPITPPLELVQQWIKEPQYITEDQLGKRMNLISMNEIKFREIIDKISQYSADQELEACLLLVGDGRRENLSQVIALRNARRPKPPSVKEQALARTDAILNDPGRALLVEVRETLELNRRALEELPE
jgi:hypothetical protein